MNDVESGPANKQGLLFITGTARSGTTSMANFLRRDPRIVMGRERYGWRLRDRTEFTPALFEKDRFCLEYQPDDSHHLQHHPYYTEAYAYFDEARWVGDKIPALFRNYDLLFSRFKGARVIYMARELHGVAESYQGRANQTLQRVRQNESVERAWPPDRGWEEAVTDWNTSVHNTVERLGTEAIHILDYDRLYRDGDTLEALYRFLELPVEEPTRRVWATMENRRAGIEANRVNILDEATHAVIEERADIEAFERLKASIRY